MPESVREEYLEAREIIESSPRAASALLRLAIQKLMKEIGESGKNIYNDIANLVNKGLSVKIQQALDMHERIQLLSSLWNWDYYFHYQKIPDFTIINEYKTVLVVFSGHGQLLGTNQIFVFNQYWMRVNQISEKLVCENITVVVESCESVYWQTNFTNRNTNGVYTSDLWGNNSYWEAITTGVGYDSNTYSFEYRAYDSVFLDCLLLGDSYTSANDTAIKQIINYFGVGLALMSF